MTKANESTIKEKSNLLGLYEDYEAILKYLALYTEQMVKMFEYYERMVIKQSIWDDIPTLQATCVGFHEFRVSPVGFVKNAALALLTTTPSLLTSEGTGSHFTLNSNFGLHLGFTTHCKNYESEGRTYKLLARVPTVELINTPAQKQALVVLLISRSELDSVKEVLMRVDEHLGAIYNNMAALEEMELFSEAMEDTMSDHMPCYVSGNSPLADIRMLVEVNAMVNYSAIRDFLEECEDKPWSRIGFKVQT